MDDDEIQEIRTIFESLHPITRIVRLCKSCKAIAVSDTIKLASCKFRYINCSKCFSGENLMEINSFVQCTALVNHGHSTNVESISKWFVCCTSYMRHPQCQAWFGYPTQVWTTVLSPETHRSYYLLSKINSRVVFVKANVNFGRVIGDDTVFVVTPIPFQINL